MKFRIFSLILILAFLFCQNIYASDIVTTGIFSKKSKKVRYIEHTVNTGETLWSILNRYGITLTDIQADNPTVNILGVKQGDLIKFNKAKLGSATPEQIDSDLANQLDLLNKLSGGKQQIAKKDVNISKITPSQPTADKDKTETEKESTQLSVEYIYHLVKKGETLFSLSQKYKTTVPILRELNKELLINGILSEGAMLKVPNPLWIEAQKEEIEIVSEKITSSRVLRRYSASEPVNISLMLPFKGESGAQSQQYMEFYQGFLLGLDSMKNVGISVNLKVFDTGRGVETVADIINGGTLNKSDLIVGPVYENQFCDVATYANKHRIPIVSPLATVNCGNEMVFQLAPDESVKNDKLREYLVDKNVIFIRSIDDDEEFISQIKQIIGNSYSEMVFAPKQRPEDIVLGLSSDKTNLFIVASKRGEATDAILSKLSSVKTFSFNKGIAVLGSSRIARMPQINPAYMFRLNVSFITSYHADRTNSKVMTFDNDYISAYGDVPSLYAYRGYDVAVLFMSAMHQYGSNFMKFMDGYSKEVLQINYHFKSAGFDKGLLNDQWSLINYSSDNTITVR